MAKTKAMVLALKARKIRNKNVSKAKKAANAAKKASIAAKKAALSKKSIISTKKTCSKSRANALNLSPSLEIIHDSNYLPPQFSFDFTADELNLDVPHFANDLSIISNDLQPPVLIVNNQKQKPTIPHIQSSTGNCMQPFNPNMQQLLMDKHQMLQSNQQTSVINQSVDYLPQTENSTIHGTVAHQQPPLSIPPYNLSMIPEQNLNNYLVQNTPNINKQPMPNRNIYGNICLRNNLGLPFAQQPQLKRRRTAIEEQRELNASQRISHNPNVIRRNNYQSQPIMNEVCFYFSFLFSFFLHFYLC